MKILRLQEVDELRENYEWLRKKEYFNGEDAARVSNMYSKYYGKALSCYGCGGSLSKAKWDLVGYFSNIISDMQEGRILIEEEIVQAVAENEEKKKQIKKAKK